ncbi:MAG: NRDE family protein [Zoogloeaceae bacterium]|jgi:uncharacterized protein with NRDE domain|nr:NRDE family protein [Zoogloeaceae bacterium]
MCLVLLAWRTHEACPLFLVANRDELYRRPALPLAPWRDAPEIIGGRDLEAGGGWLAAHADGRFAAITNVRQGDALPGQESRGEILTRYFNNHLEPHEFIEKIEMNSYAGFNLLLGSRQEVLYCSNRNGVRPRSLSPGIYGLSNHRLDTPWPKLLKSRRVFAAALDPLDALPAPEVFFRILSDRGLAPDHDLPHTGVPLEIERMLSAIFIVSPTYGTRASTLMRQHPDGHFSMIERSFGPNGVFLGESRAETGPASGFRAHSFGGVANRSAFHNENAARP